MVHRRRRRSAFAPDTRVDQSSAAINDSSLAVIQTIKGSLERGLASKASKAMRGLVWPLSCQGQDACRLVQAVMREVALQELTQIISELQGHVLEACLCLYANFVLECALNISPAPVVQFVSNEIEPFAREVACHRIGCRIIIRMIEHGSAGRIPGTIAASAESLSRRRYGSFVVRSLLEHGASEEKEAIAVALGAYNIEAAIQSACHRTASYVVRCALACQVGPAADLKALLASCVQHLAFDPCGSSMMEDRALHCEFFKGLTPVAKDLARSKQGLRLLKTMSKQLM